jgi:hypothetical protein
MSRMFELLSREYDIQLLLETEVRTEVRTKLREQLRKLDEEMDVILRQDPKLQA